MKYTVVIEETIADDFEIDAESEKDAISRAINKYKNAEFVLEPGNIQETKISVITESGELSAWEMIE